MKSRPPRGDGRPRGSESDEGCGASPSAPPISRSLSAELRVFAADVVGASADASAVASAGDAGGSAGAPGEGFREISSAGRSIVTLRRRGFFGGDGPSGPLVSLSKFRLQATGRRRGRIGRGRPLPARSSYIIGGNGCQIVPSLTRRKASAPQEGSLPAAAFLSIRAKRES